MKPKGDYINNVTGYISSGITEGVLSWYFKIIVVIAAI